MEKGKWQPLGWLRRRLCAWLLPDILVRLELAEETISRLDGFPAADTLARMEILERGLEAPEPRDLESGAPPGDPWGCGVGS